ncbi:MAG: Type II secretion system protein E [Candidatus Magasanikbacteria bacterium GW2011_GWC2_37_14]|uniref:Type II secretion system protein E n=1 Tax=Candidatus Magasanikbacteria bacterium GW2011_GWC2_37_14 TaxID=1619046 RepID=A0A0G0G9Q0_9BACT|nr:MAG: Type II secretion system protein E [Candidatus Magasanikbacteria bacterium GW2011_GWC2_37_14]
MLPEKILKQLLTKKFKISETDFKANAEKAKKLNKDIEQLLLDDGTVDEMELYTAAAEIFEVPIVALKGVEIKKEVLNLVPAPLAQTHQVVAFNKTNTEIHLAMLDPQDIQTIEFLHRKTALTPKIFLTTPSDIKEALHRYHADLESDVSITQLKDSEEIGENDLKKAAEEMPIINIVNSTLEHAVYEGASDIHIEPTEKEVTVRYRVDGILKNVMTLPKTVAGGIVARIKVLSNLKLDEHMKPQDGRFKIQIQEEKLSFRVSIIPVYDGEKVVMRLLHEGQKPLSLDQLGFLPGPRKLVEQAIEKPHGMILVTGPTGSGKTTTLYSLLGILNQPDVNISTIEDPIEYHVKGINQSQINTQVGFTFAVGLRAFLRQDPDIIMVGEIRDQETAEIAIHAAMTGHLVLSTLHTNDAPTTLPRLLDMGIAPFLLAFTANIIVAQRLVRKICENCKKEYQLQKNAIAELEKLFDIKQIKTLFEGQNIKLNSKEDKLESITFYHGEGCRRCGNSGHKGRIGIYEILEINKDIAQKINERANADVIKKYAREQGMITMLEDGLVKAKQGITTIEEVLRVTRE